MPFFIIKSSGEKEFFSLKKFSRSLRRAGASSALINDIIDQIKKMHPKSTQEIHQFAMERLTEQNRPVAAHYNLKQAIMKLGPAGYPFEQYVARILQADGYTTVTNQFIQGLCITHEVDVIASNTHKNYLVECKFHNRMGLKTDVKVPLYIQARFEDIANAEKKDSSRAVLNQAWIWSNTQFTIDAINYAECVNMRLTGWSYPAGQSLAELIDRYKMYPITALTCISQQKKNILIEHGMILCSDISEDRNKLIRLGFKPRDIERIIAEAHGICDLEPQE